MNNDMEFLKERIKYWRTEYNKQKRLVNNLPVNGKRFQNEYQKLELIKTLLYELEFIFKTENSKQGRTFPSLAVDEVVRPSDDKERAELTVGTKKAGSCQFASTSQDGNLCPFCNAKAFYMTKEPDPTYMCTNRHTWKRT